MYNEDRSSFLCEKVNLIGGLYETQSTNDRIH